MTDSLLKTRLVDMTGEELVSLIREATEEGVINNVRANVDSNKTAYSFLRGYKELAAYLKCSVPTVCRMVTRGDIRKPAIIRSGKTLLFVPEIVIRQLAEVDSRWQISKNSKNRE